MATKTIRKNFNSFRGRDLRSSDLTRGADYAIDLDNVIFTKNSALATRAGNKIVAPAGQFTGLFDYIYSNTTTGATEEEILSLDENLRRRRSNTFTVAYTPGAATMSFLSIKLYDAGGGPFFYALVTEDESQSPNTSNNYIYLGTGLEASPITLADLKTQIEGIAAGYSVTISGDTTIPAAFLPITTDRDLLSGSVALTYYDWQDVNSTVTDPFTDYNDARGDEDFENASHCNFQDDLIIATGYTTLQKYDGQTVYRVGLPQPVSSVANNNYATDSGGGSGPNGTYSYTYVYKQVDNRGNITESKQCQADTVTVVDNTINVVVDNILAGTGFNTNCAQVNGAQATVNTITVDAGHTLKVGDTAYFLDNVTAAYVTRGVTAIGATTVTVDGAPVTVSDNIPISNNLRIEIFRTAAAGADYFLVAEIPNNSLTATQTYADSKTDLQLGAQFFIPDRSHDLLDVMPKYVISHEGVLVCSGSFDNPNTVYYSDIEDLESFPEATNQFDITSTIAGGVTGLVSDQEHLIVGKRFSLFVVSGSLADSNFRVEKIGEGNTGIACHNASADIGTGVIILSEHGWWLITRGVDVLEIGAPINSIFFDVPYDESVAFRLKRAFGVYNPHSEQYICFLPTESGTGLARYVNGNSQIHVFDNYKKGWIRWTGPNMGGGLIVAEEALWWQSRIDNSGTTGTLFKEHTSGTEHDYADHNEPINLVLGCQWEDGGEPAQFKYIPRMRVYNITPTVFQTAFTLTVTTELDYRLGIPDTTFTIPFNQGTSSGGWGLFPWGQDAWGSPVTIAPRPRKLRNKKFRALRFVMSHGEWNERAVITGWEYELIFSYEASMNT